MLTRGAAGNFPLHPVTMRKNMDPLMLVIGSVVVLMLMVKKQATTSTSKFLGQATNAAAQANALAKQSLGLAGTIVDGVTRISGKSTGASGTSASDPAQPYYGYEGETNGYTAAAEAGVSTNTSSGQDFMPLDYSSIGTGEI